MEYHRDFLDAVRALDDPTQPATESLLYLECQSFVAEWKAGTTEHELRTTWDYKGITCPQGGGRKLVYQLRIAGQFRVLLAVFEQDPPELWFLDAFRKSPNRQQQGYRTACQRARALQRRAR